MAFLITQFCSFFIARLRTTLFFSSCYVLDLFLYVKDRLRDYDIADVYSATGFIQGVVALSGNADR